LPFAGLAAVAPIPFILAHLALATAAILARTAADLRRRRFVGASSATLASLPRSGPGCKMQSPDPYWSLKSYDDQHR
jgi:hypothetical protein